jgi:hypothetical protein
MKAARQEEENTDDVESEDKSFAVQTGKAYRKPR